MKPILIALPSRYIQGPGVLRELPLLLEERGIRRPMLLWGNRTRGAVAELVLPTLAQEGISQGSIFSLASAPGRNASG